jgi:hypothetical protein
MTLALFFALYCLEAGLFFTIVPWTRVWTANPLLQHSIAVSVVANNPFFRGFITGFGIVHLIIGVRDIIVFAQQRRAGEHE